MRGHVRSQKRPFQRVAGSPGHGRSLRSEYCSISDCYPPVPRPRLATLLIFLPLTTRTTRINNKVFFYAPNEIIFFVVSTIFTLITLLIFIWWNWCSIIRDLSFFHMYLPTTFQVIDTPIFGPRADLAETTIAPQDTSIAMQ